MMKDVIDIYNKLTFIELLFATKEPPIWLLNNF